MCRLSPELRLALLLLAWLLFVPPAPATTVVQTAQVRAELLAHAPAGVAAGKPLWLGLLLQHQPQWHTYWKNPGDSGLATTFEWQLPAGVGAADIDWPAPQALPFGPLLNYGYEGEVLLPVALTLPAGFDAPALGFAAALMFALGGGVLLNLMPCVFPVLSLKLLGFARHGGDTRTRVIGGVAYGAGVVFTFLGLGLALPYLIVSLVPAVARWLPRPGPWMARLRTLMAFPMFATVVWLLWVLGIQVGLDGVIGLLALLVAVAFASWAWALRGRSRWALGLPALALVVATTAWSLPGLRGAAPAPTAAASGWAPWSNNAVARLRAEGRPVFVDFTAAWCVTCQVNKRVVLADPTVLNAFERAGVALLRADWTTRDPAITAALAALGRGGVPVYALYPAHDGPPQILGELLSAAEIRSALSNLQPKESP